MTFTGIHFCKICFSENVQMTETCNELYYYYYYYYYLLQLGFHPAAVVLTLVHTIQMKI
jgi:hypothetical protein